MSAAQLVLPRLRPDQWQIVNHPAKRKKCRMGRRWGKTLMGGAVSLSVANQGGHCGWGAPNYKNSRPLWRWVEQVCRPLESIGVKLSQSERVATFPSGGFLGIYSLDNPDSIRSEAFHLFIVDESAKVTDPEALDDALEPTLADYDGTRYDISTPRGKNHFFTDWNLANSDETGFSKAWHAPSSDNPHPNIQKAVLLAAERVKQGRLTERSYRQEWLAEFVEGGAFFEHVRDCATLAVSTPTKHKSHKIVIGGDFAQVEDFTVLSAMCCQCNEQVDLERFNKLSWQIQKERVIAFCKKWGHYEGEGDGKVFVPASILPERNTIGMMIEELLEEGITVLLGPDGKPGFNTSAQTKPVLVKTLYASLASQSIKIINNPIQVSELEMFEEKPTAYGATYSAPAGLHDDTVIGLALSNYAVDKSVIQFW